MTDLATSILELKSEFVSESLDIAQTHIQWVARHLQQGRYQQALTAFDRFLTAARAAAAEMKEIRASLTDKDLGAAAASEWRRENGRAA